MEKECNQFGTIPFSYDILDAEAAKISTLMQAVQERVIQGGERLAQDLFDWAEQFHIAGRRDEAEFLYLHAINQCERQRAASYPMAFTGLRDFARTLVERTAPSVVPVEPTTLVEAAIVETHLEAAA